MAPIDWMDVQSAGASGADRPPEPARAGERASPRGAALLEGLNPEQRAAVLHAEGPLLILAGAGSGKTRVITRRIAWLLEEGLARPHELLAITFTNKAAREMRERVERLVGTRGLWVSTFHATCARILRREIDVLGWSGDFTIYDTHDKNQLVKKLVAELGYDAARFKPALVGGWISDRKNEAGAGAGGDGASGGSMEHEVLVRVMAAYEEALRRNNALDFDDLLLKTRQVFREHPGVRDAWATRFRFVMVDEYQDTNRVQYELVRALSGAHGNLAVCGDPDQSIYAWRGADVRNILDFERDFPAAVVVKLERNYRSVGNVLAAAQAVIAHNVGRKEKGLWTEREDGEKLCVLVCADENDEGDEIARQLRSLLAGGRRADECAVFYRVNFMQRALERALRLAGIPYQVLGGVEFYARREVKDLVSYLQLLVNPADDGAALRVLNVPQRGVGEKSAGDLAAWAAERGVPLSAAAREPEAWAALRGRAKKGVEAFGGLLDALSGLADGPAALALDRVIDETDYYGWLKQLPDAGETARDENVDELRAHAETYDRENPEGKLRGFLQDIALVSDVDAWEEGVAKVTLMTMHSAKGLEFPVVFVAGLEEELLPHARAAETEEGVEEERRLLYVAMTRAMERLFLTRAEWRFHFGQSLPRAPSRFLEELPADRLETFGGEEDEEAALGAWETPLDEPGLKAGAVVEHDHFGRGLVEQLSGAGANARATVRFSRAGTKVLLLQYAGLRVVS